VCVCIKYGALACNEKYALRGKRKRTSVTLIITPHALFSDMTSFLLTMNTKPKERNACDVVAFLCFGSYIWSLPQTAKTWFGGRQKCFSCYNITGIPFF
jgi:hypothetical protein